MRTCRRCAATPTHLAIVDEGESLGTAAVPYCGHHALQIGIEALVNGRDIEVVDVTTFLMNYSTAPTEAAPPYDN